ncbi:MAG: beta-lactamase family protein [Defluviitaleaceae bacterium]|nr:beta-lactamase family protein [Defluviitaleaceae bacterium]
MKKILTSIALIASLATPTFAQTTSQTQLVGKYIFESEEVLELLENFRESFSMQDFAFSVVDINTGLSYYNSDKLFQIASITKIFTAVGIMQLVERGLINLDSPITYYIPNFSHLPHPVTGGDYREVTVRMLLNHTSGIQNDFWGSEALTLDAPSNCFLNNLVYNLSTRYFLFPPGTSISYNNNAFNLLGIIIANVAGYSEDPAAGYISYINENILNPLEMNSTTFPVENLENFAGVYSAPNTLAANELNFFFNVLPTGSLLSTASDMSHFMQFLLEGDEEVLGEYYMQKLFYLHPIEFESGFSTNITNPRFSLGFMHQIWPTGILTIGHGGNLIFHHSNMVLNFETGVGAFSATNTLSGASGGVFLAQEMMNFLIGLMGYEPNILSVTESVVQTRQAEELSIYTGLYLTGTGFFNVFLEENALYLQIHPEIILELIPLEDGSFIENLTNQRIRFTELEGTMLMILGNFNDQIVTRITPSVATDKELSLLGRFYPTDLSLVSHIEIRQHEKGFVYFASYTNNGQTVIMPIIHLEESNFILANNYIFEFGVYGLTWWGAYEYLAFEYAGVLFIGGN